MVGRVGFEPTMPEGGAFTVLGVANYSTYPINKRHRTTFFIGYKICIAGLVLQSHELVLTGRIELPLCG